MQLQSPSGTSLVLVPYTQVGTLNYFEIKGKDGELTIEEKREILIHLTQARPDLMPSWHSDMQGRFPIGRNILGLTDDKRLVIEKSDIKVLVFSFDINKNSAIKNLGFRLIEACDLPGTLSFRVKDQALIFQGKDLCTEHSIRLQRYMLDKVKAEILVLQNTPTVLTENNSRPNSYFDFARLHAYQRAKKIMGHNTVALGEHYISLPLSSLNILLNHFKIPYVFEYLGEAVDNTECLRVISDGFRRMDSEDACIMDAFHRDLADAEIVLGLADLRADLSKKSTKICQQKIPNTIIPASVRPKL